MPGKRVQGLEGHQPVGWATDRWWDGTVVGDRGNGRSRPDQCLDCGRVVVPQLIVRIDGVAWDEVVSVRDEEGGCG